MRRTGATCPAASTAMAAATLAGAWLFSACPAKSPGTGKKDATADDAAACTDLCQAGERQCTGNGYQPCGNFDQDACLEWGPVVPCNQGERCIDGMCQPGSFTDDCVEGSVKCNENGTGFHTCEYRSDLELWVWGTAVLCSADQTCSCGRCITGCVDECVQNSRQCAGDGYQVCGDTDDDPCLDWGPVIPCPVGEVCSDGVCDTQCVPECSAGDTRCGCSGQSVQSCGDFDSDPCLEWAPPIPCGAGAFCRNGTCTSCPGAMVGPTCVYLADRTPNTRAEAISICAGLGTGWSICSSSQICQTAVYTYLDFVGCACDGGENNCACSSSPNIYVHALDHETQSYYIRVAEISGCSDSGLCTDSVSETCGIALCCN